MKEVIIELKNKGPIGINDEIDIEANIDIDIEKEFKFIEGHNKVWTPIKEFSNDSMCRWKPQKSGDYMLMVQCREKGSNKPYDFLGKTNIIVEENSSIIKNINLSSSQIKIGEKAEIEVEGTEDVMLYRFYIKGEKDWEKLSDYTINNKYVFTGIEEGVNEILVECKKINSEECFDNYSRVKIEVKPLNVIEIMGFKALSKRIITNEELIFSVDVNYEKTRTILYKFMKIYSNGKMTCIQDFSSKNVVAFKEHEAGKYKILCMVKDVFSNKEFDDRATLTYEVEAYDEVRIRSFKSDLNFPQSVGTFIKLNVDAVGGRELLYRYIIDGPISFDSGFLRSNLYLWRPREEGNYNITVKVKDISFKGECEAMYSINYEVDKDSDKPVRIKNIDCDKGRKSLINQPINILSLSDGGSKVVYKYLIIKDGVQIEETSYEPKNTFDFTPKEKGYYEVEVRAKDFYSEKEYDSALSTYINVYEFLPAEIDYILYKNEEKYIVNDEIDLNVIAQNTNSMLIKFRVKLNCHVIQEGEFLEETNFKIKPKVSGKYTFEIIAKNKKSTEEFDCKKEVIIYVQDAMKINSTKVLALNDEIKLGEEITFKAQSIGGKDVCYEFYMMKDGNWMLIQQYSKKTYYTFIPFLEGEYKVLVLAKSFYKKINYEDYDILSFSVLD